MPYTQMADISEMGQDRQLSILTTANIAGAAVAGLLMWQLCSKLHISGSFFSLGWWAEGILIGGAAVGGVALTRKWNGLSLLERLSLRLGFHMRRLAGQTELVPHSPLAPRQQHMSVPTIYRGTEVVARPFDPEEDL